MAKRKVVFFALLLSAFFLGTQTVNGSPVSQNGRLRLCGTKICNEAGHAIQLRGMSNGAFQWFDDCTTPESLDALAYEWGADIFRISVYIQEGGYESNPEWTKKRVDEVVDMCEERGMYALIDWHVLTPGDPWYNMSRAKSFFDYMSKKHGQKRHVLFEIANEPNGVKWSRIKSYAEEIIPLIRKNAPQSIIIVGTPGYSGEPWKAVNDRLTGSLAHNVMYAKHFYAADSHQGEIDAVKNTIEEGLPIFATEWGAMQGDCDGALDLGMTQKWIDLMQQKKVSWVMYAYCDNSRSCGTFEPGTCADEGPWTGSSLKESGRLGMDLLQNPPDDFPDSPPPPEVVIGSPLDIHCIPRVPHSVRLSLVQGPPGQESGLNTPQLRELSQ